MALLLANGSMSSSTSGEGDIRKNLLQADLIECMVALPSQLFTNAQIPACIWFMTKSKKAQDDVRDRSGETLFIDARNLGYMETRVLRDFAGEDIAKIVDAFRNWKRGVDYEDEPGFCKSAMLEEIGKHGYVLMPGPYVGVPEEEDHGEPFADKIQCLTTELAAQFDEAERLQENITRSMNGLGFLLHSD